MDRRVVALVGGGVLLGTAIAVDVGGFLPAASGGPLWYALGGVCLGYWVAMLVWASGER